MRPGLGTGAFVLDERQSARHAACEVPRLPFLGPSLGDKEQEIKKREKEEREHDLGTEDAHAGWSPGESTKR